MSNDISGNYSNYMNLRGITNSISSDVRSDKGLNVQEPVQYDMSSYDYLDSLGHAKVNMDKNSSTKASIEAFIQDPHYVELHNQFCDDLVKQGYPLEEAISKTNYVFNTLKTPEIY